MHSKGWFRTTHNACVGTVGQEMAGTETRPLAAAQDFQRCMLCKNRAIGACLMGEKIITYLNLKNFMYESHY
jgi:hypothetical protein